ncbi:MAG: hypothetical protein EBW71_06620, partial [Betaproteobacteria bacterium]|nr:hypothetical protein [Betaproteobacteria bacterium]
FLLGVLINASTDNGVGGHVFLLLRVSHIVAQLSLNPKKSGGALVLTRSRSGSRSSRRWASEVFQDSAQASMKALLGDEAKRNVLSQVQELSGNYA